MASQPNMVFKTVDKTEVPPEPSDHLDDAAQPVQRFLNRDLSWLEFNRRVLAQVSNERVPLLERIKFLTIVTSNLDEFFMKRIGLLRRRQAAHVDRLSLDGMTVAQQLAALRPVILEQMEQQARMYHEVLLPALQKAGIHIVAFNDLDEQQRRRVNDWYRREVFPVLTPLAVDQGHRFPFISNLSVNLGIVFTPAHRDTPCFARVKIPQSLPGFVKLVDHVENRDSTAATQFVPLIDVIAGNLERLLPDGLVHEVFSFRVTRGAGVESDDEDIADLLEAVEEDIKMRRFAPVVRVELPHGRLPRSLELVLGELEAEDDVILQRRGPLDYMAFRQVAELDRPELKYPTFTPVTSTRIAGDEDEIFGNIRRRDILVHHPYESFQTSVEAFISAAADDPSVLAIKQTLYRTSSDSAFVHSLIRAAEAGKQVACLVELRARFDEQRNVQFARQLEEAGVHVAYGVVGLKTHCKCSLVVRREGSGLRTYAHIGTGNYHPTTAQLYSDCGLLTCDPLITEDVMHIFNCLTGGTYYRRFNKLLVAPFTMRDRFRELIDREIDIARSGGDGRIIVKMNSLEDPLIIEQLYEASRAGVKSLLFVRGFCCLRPGVPGLSANIRVVSIVGRFLEHSRIFHFGAGQQDPLDGDWIIGSADWMSRNLNNRVEAAVPVEDREARQRLLRIIEVMSEDNTNAWDMLPDGSYVTRQPRPGPDNEEPIARSSFEMLIADAQAARMLQ